MTRKGALAGSSMKFDKVPELPDDAPRARRLRIAAGAAVVLALLAAGGWFFFSWQRQVAADRAAARITAQRTLAQLEEARAAAAGSVATVEERVQRLEALRRALRAAATLRPDQFQTPTREIQRIEQELDELRNRDKLQLSLERERAAAALSGAGEFAAAEPLWRDALALQQEANRTSSESARNLDRELRLQQELMRAVAEPLQMRATALLQRAAEANGAGQWEEALALYREVRAIQERLNREYPRSRYSDLAAIARIDSEIASLSDDGLAARVAAQWEEARRLAADESPKAEEAFGLAAATQRLLNQRFPRSRFVSMERLAEIEADRQTAAAAPLLRRARERAEEARIFFRKRQVFLAQMRVKEALEVLEDLRVQLPRARGGADEALRLQLSFLNLRSGDLAALQDRIYEQLAPLPGRAEFAMLRTELTQADFARVMSTNPSRTGGRALPVESVTHMEAEEFCRRLSWVMGATVRLPTAGEMAAAGGQPDDFAQVEGGVGEWLTGRVEADAASAWVWRTQSVAPEVTSRNSRDRTRGFRVVVEIDLTAAAN